MDPIHIFIYFCSTENPNNYSRSQDTFISLHLEIFQEKIIKVAASKDKKYNKNQKMPMGFTDRLFQSRRSRTMRVQMAGILDMSYLGPTSILHKDFP